jgi:hypothetical protein
MNEAIQKLYDEAAAAHEDGVKTAELKEEILPDVIDLLADTERNLEQEARDSIDATIDPERRRRRRALREDLEQLLAALPEEDGYADPLLDLAFPMGTEAGEDKVLRHWTKEDLRNVVLMAYRKAGEVTQAAVALDGVVARAEHEMTARSAQIIGEMYS